MMGHCNGLGELCLGEEQRLEHSLKVEEPLLGHALALVPSEKDKEPSAEQQDVEERKHDAGEQKHDIGMQEPAVGEQENG